MNAAHAPKAGRQLVRYREQSGQSAHHDELITIIRSQSHAGSHFFIGLLAGH